MPKNGFDIYLLEYNDGENTYYSLTDNTDADYQHIIKIKKDIKQNREYFICDKNCYLRHCVYELNDDKVLEPVNPKGKKEAAKKDKNAPAEEKPKKKFGKVKNDFKLKLENDLICQHFFQDKILLLGSLTGQILIFDTEKAAERFYDLDMMAKEEFIGNELDKIVEALAKKKKKAKGKRGASAKKKLPKIKDDKEKASKSKSKGKKKK